VTSQDNQSLIPLPAIALREAHEGIAALPMTGKSGQEIKPLVDSY
jgi:hypothetical protein